MTYSLSYCAEENYVLAIYEGPEDFSSLKISIIAILHELVTNNCSKVISDYSKSTITVSVLEMVSLENFVNEQASSFGLIAPFIIRAQIRKDIDSNIKNYDFFENYSVNRAQKIKTFTIFKEAENWLRDH